MLHRNPHRYARRGKPVGIPTAVSKVVGVPDVKPGKTKCKPNQPMAWVPSLGRPRMLETRYANYVAASSLDAVLVSVTFVGSMTPAIEELQLVLYDGTAVTIFKAGAAGPNPRCADINVYAVPAGLVPAAKASMAVTGVRLIPSSKVAKSKYQLVHVSQSIHTSASMPAAACTPVRVHVQCMPHERRGGGTNDLLARC